MHAPSTSAADRPAASPVPTPRASRSPRSSAPERGPAADPAPGTDQTGDVLRWSVFCCALVPVVLLAYGTSLGGAAGTALGLVSVTAACRVLLRRSERGLRAETGRTRRRS